jgi:hypothetical protein
MSNIVVRLKYRRGRGGLEPVVYVWRENSEPRILGPSAIRGCAEEAARLVEKLTGGG